jgi:hypothetical protein
MDRLRVPRYRAGARGRDDSDDRKTERPGGEAHDRSLAAFAYRDPIGVKAVKADRHTWAALVRTINSLASRHRQIGDDACHSGVTSASRILGLVLLRVTAVTRRSRNSSISADDAFAALILTLGFSHMKRFPSRLVHVTAALLASATTACASSRPARAVTAIVMPSVATLDDASVTTAFRALLDEVIGDSADRVCLSVATATGADADPSSAVMRALGGRRATHVLTRSACAADERNFGNPRGLLRLRDVSRADEHTLIIHADAVGDHTARYECVVPASARARCRITSRD